MTALADAHVLILATSGFEESELFEPRRMLIDRGARVSLASPTRATIRATVLDAPGRTIDPDLTIAEAEETDYDALILPGGLINPDALRIDPAAIALVRRFVASGKPVGAICHGPWLLVEADALRGRTATGWPSIRTDLRNAGATVIDEPAVTDGNIVTSRKPADAVPFTEALIALIEAA
jgi:protease I